MALSMTFDVSSFNKRIAEIVAKFPGRALQANRDIAKEALRLSSFEVPHDTGLLQASGSVEDDPGDKTGTIAGYNKVYAARLHEHPEYRFQKGRKGKYLEDPIKNNLDIFRGHFADRIQEAFA